MYGMNTRNVEIDIVRLESLDTMPELKSFQPLSDACHSSDLKSLNGSFTFSE